VLVKLSADRRLLERMHVIEAESIRVAEWQAVRWSRYGIQDEGSALQELLDVWFRDMAEVTVEAELLTNRDGNQKGPELRGGKYQLWSAQFMETKKRARSLRGLMIALRLKQCSQITFRNEWRKLATFLWGCGAGSLQLSGAYVCGR
jgi:hypothetical protein